MHRSVTDESNLILVTAILSVLSRCGNGDPLDGETFWVWHGFDVELAEINLHVFPLSIVRPDLVRMVGIR